QDLVAERRRALVVARLVEDRFRVQRFGVALVQLVERSVVHVHGGVHLFTPSLAEGAESSGQMRSTAFFNCRAMCARFASRRSTSTGLAESSDSTAADTAHASGQRTSHFCSSVISRPRRTRVS